MTSRYVIEATDISKEYPLQRATAHDLRASLQHIVRAPSQWFCRDRGKVKTKFHALRNINFHVEHGTTLGIVGSNGSGKSTLLKLLARITAPTSGEIRLRGRVASLLEVGTGFHPELSGRENIFLNGAILGMKRAEIRARFDEIVDFAGVEDFLDTPIKHYSSGMYVRLAFAVAAHLHPEILLVDEVLAVGDTAFQKKCLSKMHHIAEGGRTVLFVSHDLAAVSRLCSRGLLLQQGQIIADGPMVEVIGHYLSDHLQGGIYCVNFADSGTLPGNDWVRLCRVRLTQEGAPISQIDPERPLELRMDYELLKDAGVILQMSLHDAEGACLFTAICPKIPKPSGVYEATAVFPASLLASGFFSVDLRLSSEDGHTHIHETSVLTFHVHGDDPGVVHGALRSPVSWRISRILKIIIYECRPLCTLPHRINMQL